MSYSLLDSVHDEQEIKIVELKYNNSKFSTSAMEDEEYGSSDVDIITLYNIHKTYLLGLEGVPALRGVTTTIKKGEWVIIFGTSGGGKTSLLNIIGTIDTPTKGEITICGTKITSNTKDVKLADLRLNKLGFVFQTFNLLPSMTSLENVEMPMILQKKLTASERRVRATSLLSKMGLADRLNHLPSMLSGGEQQRVTIARALANDPELMLLDEPTGDLDTRNTEIVMNILANLNREENKTLVMVTHDVGLKNFAHRVIWMRDGKIQRIETIPEERRKTQLEELSHKLSLGKEKVKGVGQFANTELRKPSAYKPITKGNIEAPIPYRVDESVKNKVDDISILSTTSTTIVNL